MTVFQRLQMFVMYMTLYTENVP